MSMYPTCVVRDGEGDLCPSDGVDYYDSMETETFFTHIRYSFRFRGFDLTDQILERGFDYALPWEFFE